MRLRKMMAILLALCTVFFLAGCGGGGGGGGSDEEEEAATWPVEFYSEVGGGSPVSAIRVAPATGTYKYIYFYKNKKYESGDLNNGILTKTGEGSYLGGDPHNNVTISLTGTFEGSTLIGESVTISSGSLTVAGVSFTRSTSSNGGSNGGNGGNNGGGSTPASTVPLCFTAADGDVEVYVYIKVDGDRTDVPRFEWSSDGVAWSPVETWNKSKTDYLITTLTSGSKMYIRALDSNNFLYSLNASGIINTRFKFAGTGTVAASGNVMSLLDKNNTLNAIPSVKCFYNLFAFCGKLTSAPELPATTLTDYCYQSMFQDCTSLTSAPKLPATTLADYCYFSMFEGCSSLKSMRVDFTSWINTSSTERWVTDVGSGGTFICPVALLEEIGTKNLPNDWELQVFGAEDGNGGSTPASTVPLCFTAAGGNVEVSLYIRVDGDRTDVPSFEWSSDGVAWSPVETWNKSKTDYLITTLTSGSKMYIRALDSNNFLYSLNASGIINTRFKFAGTGTVAASGNVMSLLDKNNTLTAIPSVKCFYNLFAFCDKLTSAPELPATTLTDYCYQSMFQDCTSLTSAPKLPATTLADYCYFSMFEGCTSLTKAPMLSATILAGGCYESMFQGCSALKSMRAYFTSWTGTGNWVTDVGAGGIFICPVTLPKETGTSKIPSSWKYAVMIQD